MPLPWLFESTFEPGTTAEWDAEADTGSRLDVAHYTDLARFPWPEAAPYRGAFVARWTLGDTNDHTLTAGAVNVAADETFGLRFPLYLAPDLTATANDTFPLLELQATGTVELAVGLRLTAATGAIEIGLGETAPTVFAASPLPRGRWVQIEVTGNVDNGVGNDGDATLYVDGAAVATVTGLDQGAITDLVVGTQDTLATTTGTLLVDHVVVDQAAAGTSSRIGPLVDRWPLVQRLTTSSHVFVGPGTVANLSLVSGAGTDCVATLYDTDRGDTRDAYKIAVRLNNITNSELVDPAGMPVPVQRGAYVALAGTNPEAVVLLRSAAAYGSGGAVRGYGQRTRRHPLELA